MGEKNFTVDVQRLRETLQAECMGAYFGGGFGAALSEKDIIDRASPDKLIKIAQKKGVDLKKYQV